MKAMGKYRIFKRLINLNGIRSKNFTPNGFTMIEIISVLVIIGILSAVAVSKMDSTDVYDVAMEIETMKIHLRYSQIRAMSHNEPWGIKISNGTSYSLQKNGSTAPVNLPNKDSATYYFAKGISINPGNQVINFDDLGSPGNADIVITLKKQGKNPRRINITPKTGFIY